MLKKITNTGKQQMQKCAESIIKRSKMKRRTLAYANPNDDKFSDAGIEGKPVRKLSKKKIE